MKSGLVAVMIMKMLSQFGCNFLLTTTNVTEVALVGVILVDGMGLMTSAIERLDNSY